jgi:hypothetical protein
MRIACGRIRGSDRPEEGGHYCHLKGISVHRTTLTIINLNERFLSDRTITVDDPNLYSLK